MPPGARNLSACISHPSPWVVPRIPLGQSACGVNRRPERLREGAVQTLQNVVGEAHAVLSDPASTWVELGFISRAGSGPKARASATSDRGPSLEKPLRPEASAVREFDTQSARRSPVILGNFCYESLPWFTQSTCLRTCREPIELFA